MVPGPLKRSALPICVVCIFFILVWHLGSWQYLLSRSRDYSQIPYPRPGSSKFEAANKTVNLVIASLQEDDISWTSALNIPNLKIIRFISDSTTAQYRPPVLYKGREALIYHTYLYDFYDDLPDISIMIHADERPWHADAQLRQSMLFILSQLDLDEVEKRHYVNLRVNWNDGCPSWINTTVPAEESHKQEEPFMREAYQHNFEVKETDVPDILAAPCCSQFAVTREAVRWRDREQYRWHMDWLEHTKLSDYISGRVWEHMWHSLFLRESISCPPELDTYCHLYHVCFAGQPVVDQISQLWKERHALQESTEFWRELVNPYSGVKARSRIEEIELFVEAQIDAAVLAGEKARTSHSHRGTR